MEDSPEKIQKILTELNKGLSSPEWEETDGYQAMMTVTKEPVGGFTFNASSGVIIKGFINHRTGEIKTFFWKVAAKE